MNIDKAKKHVLLRLTLMLSIVFALLSVSEAISGSFHPEAGKNIGRVEINIKSTESSETEKLQFKHIKKLEEDLDNRFVSFISEINGTAGTEGKTYPVKAVLTDSGYISYSPLQMVKGAYFNEFTCKYGMHAAVISRNLAVKIYNSYDVIGSHIELLGQKYTITGLYEDREPLFAFLTSDGIERIYIPFESLEKYDSIPLKAVFIGGEEVEKDKSRVYNLATILGGNLGINSNSYRMTDFNDVFEAVSQPVSLFIYITGILCILLLGRCFLRYIKWGRKALLKGLADKYPANFVRSNIFGITAYFLGFLVITGGAAAIYLSIRFKPYLPPDWIPQDNIFDLDYYISKIKDSIYLSNLSGGYAPTWLEAYSDTAVRLNIVFVFFMVLAFLSAVFHMKLNAIVVNKPANRVKSILVAMPVGLIVSFIFTTVFHIRYVVPFKGMMILLVFLLVHTFVIEQLSLNNLKSAFFIPSIKELLSKQGSGKRSTGL